ncbi:deoxynucleoside kinase [candidate division WOR-3 bacterium]|nr:deoxynucleoside kinase [candidate division WOR-3 bacterium]
MRFKMISLEGLPCSGKHRIASKLSEELDAKLYWSNFSQNSFLKSFYLSEGDLAFAAEVSLLLERREILKKIIQPEIFGSGLYVTDSSSHRGRIYASCTLNSDEYSLFLRMSELLLDRLPKPDMIVYLRTDPASAKSKLSKSTFIAERDLGKDYLTTLFKAMDDYLLNLTEQNMIVVNNYDDTSDDSTLALVKEIEGFGEGLKFYNFGDFA